MSGESQIEWCDRTHNDVVTGCSPVSPGCANCWAARATGGRQQHRSCLIMQKDGSTRIGTRKELVKIAKRPEGGIRPYYRGWVAFDLARLQAALKIPKNGGKAGRRIFWNSTSDTFHERLTFAEIGAQFAVMAARPDLRFFVLTKRPRIASVFFSHLEFSAEAACEVFPHQAVDYRRALVLGACALELGIQMPDVLVSDWPLPNVAVGVSAEDQERWDERVPILLDMKRRGAVTLANVSAEPMLGPIVTSPEQLAGLDQVIIGAESGPGAREMQHWWARDLGRQVLDADVCLFLKQAAVCNPCQGSGAVYPPSGPTGCAACGGVDGLLGDGRSEKVRKGCPEFWIPGHGAKNWGGMPKGWGA